MTVPLRAARALRVSTARQAEHDSSIPGQRRQGEAYCAARGHQFEIFVELGSTATNDRRPEFQRMIESGAATLAVRVPKWRPVGDSNPCCRRERAVSWASRRTGPRPRRAI
jgi:resolvase-like protein